jgi:hypothetical protein
MALQSWQEQEENRRAPSRWEGWGWWVVTALSFAGGIAWTLKGWLS